MMNNFARQQRPANDLFGYLAMFVPTM